MTRLDLFSEPFAKTGNLSAEGFRRLLGRPTLGLAQTVLRESVQNSIDAARNERGPRILIRLRKLTSEQRASLCNNILTSLPSNAESDRLLSRYLKNDRPWVMEIADFHTTGLAGPTRADIPSDNGEDPDFVNFMRNVGAARDTHQGGGTYGYGKTSLYAMSGCSTIIVDSETTNGGIPVRRFMGCHLGAAFDATGADGVRRRFTGRHWWGVADGDANVEPAEEDAARLLGSSLGMPVRDRGESGTTIMILDPQLTAEELPEIRQELIETILWNFWPRMTQTTPLSRKLSVDLEVDGQLVLIPPPEQFPPLDLFAAAISEHRVKSDDLTAIRSQRPPRHLGNLAIRRGARGERVGFTELQGGLIPQQCSHIALMRPVELVVRYIEGEAFPDKRYEWAGVFICSGDDEVEKAFASAEPPAHDDWIPDNLPKGPAKKFVNVALNRLNEIARTHVNPHSGSVVTGERGPSLARTATKMGRLLEAMSGQRPARRSAPGTGSKKRKMTAVSQPEFIRLSLGEDGKAVAWFEANLTNDGTDPSLRLFAEPYLVADGGATGTDDLPAEYNVGASYLEIDPAGPVVYGHILEVGSASGRVRVSVPMPGDAAVGVRLRLVGGANG